ncbi:phage tail protein [Halogeometricum limi]|uniref:Conserved hypothetical phage tail region protein n=1 Tax=Halogeometricum limi TaxID=555875 RepID=A0A1I6IEK6_9EURY|nr:phage tail protein [Halogeometricum limi]SFR65126.1 conserved hypothetical phage tail region protein [Halogeometricum limi]
MVLGERTDPYLGYRFLVEVDGLVVGGFSEVSGLTVEMETARYEEGGVNAFVHQFPTRLTHPNLVLKRGLTDDASFWQWMQDAVATSPVPLELATLRKNVRVVLLDAAGDESLGWEFLRAYPIKWVGPEFDAARGAVAIETLELVHEGISTMSGRP